MTSDYCGHVLGISHEKGLQVQILLNQIICFSSRLLYETQGLLEKQKVQ
jgi:hypothetical protein